MKIIGGPFSEIPMLNEKNILEVDTNKIYFVSSGRVALYLILDSILKERTSSNIIWLPVYYCDVGWKVASILKFDIRFYDVVFEAGDYHTDLSMVTSGDIVLFLNYYGIEQIDILKNVQMAKKKGCIVIEDVTQSLLSEKKSNIADYYFASLRKWTGMITGGVIYRGILKTKINKLTNIELVRYYKSFIKEYRDYLNSGLGNRIYYSNCFYKTELMIDSDYVNHSMDEKELDEIQMWDKNYVIEKRVQNANFLIDNLKTKDVLMFDNLKKGDVPFFLPIYIKNRNIVCDYLDSKNIYCSILWQRPSNCRASCNLYEHEFGLVCDERYTIDDMYRMISALNEVV